MTRIEAAPPQRPIESFEPAFNTIMAPGHSGVRAVPRGAEQAGMPALPGRAVRGDAEQAGMPALPGPALAGAELRAEQLVSALGIELDEARAFVAAGSPIPVARSQSGHEAELIAALVRTCGFAASVVADRDLALATPLVRARRVELDSGQMQVHHSGGSLTLGTSGIKLMVVGMLRNNRTDYTEGIAGMRGQSGNVLDSFEFRSEEMMMDVYGASLEESFRIASDAFDYSGLVNPLAFRSEMNFNAAIEALSRAAPAAAVDSDFARLRRLLSRAWPERARTEARGVKRAGLAGRLVAKSSVISTNRDQFDRYSRLRFVMKAAGVSP